jgi:hypothetical protein
MLGPPYWKIALWQLCVENLVMEMQQVGWSVEEKDDIRLKSHLGAEIGFGVSVFWYSCLDLFMSVLGNSDPPIFGFIRRKSPIHSRATNTPMLFCNAKSELSGTSFRDPESD